MPRLATSVAMMFTEVDLLDRFTETARTVFQAVEVQQPYGESKEDIADRIQRHNLTAPLFNSPQALVAIPGQKARFREALTLASSTRRLPDVGSCIVWQAPLTMGGQRQRS